MCVPFLPSVIQSRFHSKVKLNVIEHDDAIKWKHFSRYWPFVRGIHRSPVNSSHKGQWRGALIFSLIRAWTNGWVNNRDAGDLRHHRAHYDVTVMKMTRVCTASHDNFVPWVRFPYCCPPGWGTDRLSSQRVSNAEIYYFICCYLEQAVVQRADLSIIWEVKTFRWRHCDVQIKTRISVDTISYQLKTYTGKSYER